MRFSQSKALEIQKIFWPVGPNHGGASLDSTLKLPFYHGLDPPLPRPPRFILHGTPVISNLEFKNEDFLSSFYLD